MAGKTLGTIVLDPGHGGTTTVGGSSPNNAVSISGVKEKDLALDFCKLLKTEIENQAASAGDTVKVVMTRTTNVNVGIKARAALAGTSKAKLFLSLHFNGSTSSSARGVETFFAAVSNGNTNETEDKNFAKKVHDALLAGIKTFDPAVRDRKVKPDTLTGPGRLGTLNDVSLGNVGLTNKCLAAYFEVEFITNPTVEKVLVSGPNAMVNRRTAMASVAKAMLEQAGSMP